MIYKNKKTRMWHSKNKGEAEAIFKTRTEAEKYQKNFLEWQKLKGEENDP